MTVITGFVCFKLRRFPTKLQMPALCLLDLILLGLLTAVNFYQISH